MSPLQYDTESEVDAVDIDAVDETVQSVPSTSKTIAPNTSPAGSDFSGFSLSGVPSMANCAGMGLGQKKVGKMPLLRRSPRLQATRPKRLVSSFHLIPYHFNAH